MRKSTKRYSYNGLAGCVTQQRNRCTKRLVGLYHSYQAGIESDPTLPWSTVCEEHGNVVCHANLANAKAAMSYPDWCEDCQPDLPSF